MSTDPRFKNKTFNTSSISSYLADYTSFLSDSLRSVSAVELEKAKNLLNEVRSNGGRVFVAGNGGSGAISEHLGCDWHKGVHHKDLSPLHIHSLVSNTALLTAVANDFGYDRSFSYQLELAGLKKNDIVVLISSSGNSQNVVQAAEFARSHGVKVMGLTGFSGGKLLEIADIKLHVDFNNYGLVEDAHQALMHILAQFHDLDNRAAQKI